MTKHANIPVFIPHLGCPHQCSFCNQHSIAGVGDAPTPQAVARQCRDALSQLGPRFSTVEIAFFGGSFTAIPVADMLAYLQAAQPLLQDSRVQGIRISTRPDKITPPILAMLKEYGVTAIELGVQSMSNRVLAANGRGHTANHSLAASALIKQHGFELGHQMMIGLYTSTNQDVQATAKAIIAMQPHTVRIYPTVVLQNTPLAKLYQQGLYTAPSLADSVAVCASLLALFEAANIKVIKMGIHASNDVEKNMLAGVYHPAFRQLCESKLMLDTVLAQLQSKQYNKAITVQVAMGAMSTMLGQKRCNLQALQSLGYIVTITETKGLQRLEVELQNTIGGGI